MKIDSGVYKNTLPKVIALLEGLFLAALLTFFLLAVFAFIMLRTEISAGAENIGLICICVISCFAGGFFCGKKNDTKGFLWGLVIGILYYALILILRFSGGQDLLENMFHLFTALFYCGASGMLGGMLS